MTLLGWREGSQARGEKPAWPYLPGPTQHCHFTAAVRPEAHWMANFWPMDRIYRGAGADGVWRAGFGEGLCVGI